MSADLRRRARRVTRGLKQWSKRCRERVEQFDFLITTFACCWLLTRFFIFALRRFRW